MYMQRSAGQIKGLHNSCWKSGGFAGAKNPEICATERKFEASQRVLGANKPLRICEGQNNPTALGVL